MNEITIKHKYPIPVIDELPSILWAYRTTPKIPTGETPFALTYGAEALVPIEVAEPSTRNQIFDEDRNSVCLAAEKDLLEEMREAAHIRNANYKQIVRRSYDSHVKPRSFQVGDLVLRRREAAGQQVIKFASPWEGK